MKFVASRLSEGNKLFPSEIILEVSGIEIKIPGLLSSDTKFISYDGISAVEINSPMIGFSTITIFHSGNKVTAHGFSKDDAKAVKDEIEKRKSKNRN
jgi:hypothetical protein